MEYDKKLAIIQAEREKKDELDRQADDIDFSMFDNGTSEGESSGKAASTPEPTPTPPRRSPKPPPMSSPSSKQRGTTSEEERRRSGRTTSTRSRRRYQRQEPVTRPTPAPPTPRAVPSAPPAIRHKPTPRPAINEGSWAPVWIFIGAVIVLIGIVVLASSEPGTRTAQPPSKTPQQVAAERPAKVASAAESRIAELSFMCIDGRVCETDPVGHALELFIYGIDENLQHYWQEQRYTDEWSDNAGYVHGHALSANEQETEGHVAFVRYRNGAIPIDSETEEKLANGPAPSSGLIYSPESEAAATETKSGLIPTGVPSEQPWTITWRLKDATGQIVKELDYSLEVISCPESNFEAPESEATPCVSVINEQEKRAKEVEEEIGFHEATNKYYQPPPPPESPIP